MAYRHFETVVSDFLPISLWSQLETDQIYTILMLPSAGMLLYRRTKKSGNKYALFCIFFANWHSQGIPRKNGARSVLFLISELCCSVYYLCQLCCSMYCLCVNLYCILPLGVNPIAVNKYIISYHIISYHIISYHITSYIISYYILSYRIKSVITQVSPFQLAAKVGAVDLPCSLVPSPRRWKS
jgi:hypothetical protein